MILDEATSSLDSKTEKKIMDKLLAKFGDEKSFVIIAHRISTLKNTDRVIVFDGGDIVEEGKYKDLVKDNKSHLGQLYALQSGAK
jgi:subfamily B ATP-binding cassette protein HlyB/CyaB